MSDDIANAILNTLRYADVFDYALSRDETQRFLIGVTATRDQIESALNDPARLNGAVQRIGNLLTLPEREWSVTSRLQWSAHAATLWAHARFYARLIALFPFTRMIAVSGGLAMNNARDHDIDLVIVTTPKRLWLVRGLVVALVRLARLGGAKLCPNFMITLNALAIPTRDLYNAHELAQMVPLFGMSIHAQMLAQNDWARAFLPNAFAQAPWDGMSLGQVSSITKKFLERIMRGRLGDAIEYWEMTRKIKKLSGRIQSNVDMVQFSADVCRGFLSGHGKRILKEYQTRTNTAHGVGQWADGG